ncbi:hypothetical protein pb186bvf_006325 [Paramecium bursaria]
MRKEISLYNWIKRRKQFLINGLEQDVFNYKMKKEELYKQVN